MQLQLNEDISGRMGRLKRSRAASGLGIDTCLNSTSQ